jgi:hypothetical protein
MPDWPGSARNVRRRLFLGIAGVVLALLQVLAPPAVAADLEIALTPAPENPLLPQMGDHLSFHSVIRNGGSAPITGLVGWLSLIQTDPGNEQPVDLEDWSAHKAVAAASLAPGETIESDWPMRLIEAGTYRVFVSAMGRDGRGPVASPIAEFIVREKPVLEPGRVLPVAFGLPALIAAALLWRWRRA